MSFVDKVSVSVIAGKGGNGKLSFRHEKFIDKGGPDGGDGGRGGNVVLRASRNQNTLASFRYQRELKSEDGREGGKTNKHGRSAKDLIVDVPVGTIATNQKSEIVADLTEDMQTAIIAHGGNGGFGNAHFVSSRRQTPNFAEKGEPGEEAMLTLELKMIADVGLVGFPNAGKSTLLGRLSNARPEIADYPFTTLRPNLGVVDIDDEFSVLFADIPGLIAGAAEGKGLGHDFLRHIERTAVIVHLIDAYAPDVAASYETVRQELLAYQPALVSRPEIIVLTKIEGLDTEIVDDLLRQIRSVKAKGSTCVALSAHSGVGLKPFLRTVRQFVEKERANQSFEKEASVGLPILTLTDTSRQWSVTREGKAFVISGQKIERFAKRTDFDNDEGLQRLRSIMQRYGILHELRRQGVEAGSIIRIAGSQFPY